MTDYADLFVSDELQVRTIKLADGSEREMRFRELSALEFRRYYLAEQSDDEEVRLGAPARLIASSLCNQDGTPALTYAQALRLKPGVQAELLSAVMDVNGNKQGNA